MSPHYWRPRLRIPGHRDRDRTLQAADPWRKRKIWITSNEKMDVIRHDHITANSDVKLLQSIFAIFHERVISVGEWINPFTISCAECDEEKWSTIQNKVEPPGPIFHHG